MRKRNEFEEFLRQLEEAIDDIMNEMNLPEDRPVNIEISINLCPHMFFNSGIAAKPTRNPVDILETEKNIHAVVALPGVKEEEIQLTCSGTELEITADNDAGTVREVIDLPARVNKKFKTIYKNGILEVVFNKRKRSGRALSRQQSF
jgi:HSP20 family molecular chaperone IbpA